MLNQTAGLAKDRGLTDRKNTMDIDTLFFLKAEAEEKVRHILGDLAIRTGITPSGVVVGLTEIATLEESQKRYVITELKIRMELS